MSLDGKSLIQVSVSKHLDAIIKLTDKTILAHCLNIDNAAGLEDRLQITEINQSVNLFIQRFETAFRQATLQRHLSTLETGLDTATAASVLSLMAFSGGFAFARTRSTSDALPILCRADSRPQITQIHI
jgi:hypothetical protein